MDLSDSNCGNCGERICAFSSSLAESDGRTYCVKCAEEIDLHRLSKAVCSVCIRYLEKGDIKFVMPSRMYSSYFFDKLPILERLMCLECFRKARKLSIHSPLTKIHVIRTKINGKIPGVGIDGACIKN